MFWGKVFVPKISRLLAQLRVVAEHVNRRLKIFRILAERYRNRRRRFGVCVLT